MNCRTIIMATFLASTILAGCKKDVSSNNCPELRGGIIANNKEDVGAIIISYIASLSSTIYSQQNLETLAATISANCTINATVACFDCIKTLPSQTEIMLTFVSSGIQVKKTLDISYTPDNKMIFFNMHD